MLLAAMGCFAVLAGGVVLVGKSTLPNSAAPQAQAVAAAPLAAETAVEESRQVSIEVAAAAPVREAATNAAARAELPTDSAALVDAHLTAGEFGPALELAEQAVQVDERTALLQKVAEAQLEAGEFAAARGTIRRLPTAEARARMGADRAASHALAGGGSLADFEQLIELIQNETSGPWEEIDGAGGTISSFDTGVGVDPHGQLHRLTKQEFSGRLDELGYRARAADLNDDMARPSSLRLVSLTRLEQEIARRLKNGQPVVESMRHLAGLSRVEYVFVYPEQQEIVLGGPAESWGYDDRGMPMGMESGRPMLHLDDLVTVLRTFSPEGQNIFNCLIVPRQEGLKAAREFALRSQQRGSLSPGAGVRNFARGLQQALGLQDVQVNGIPLDSRVARVIVEADYRMKLIGVDRLKAAGIPSYFDLLPQNFAADSGNGEALRWWMTMNYDAVLHSGDRNVFQVVGPSVRCQCENEVVTEAGERIHTGKASATNQLFAATFTQKYEQLAAADSVFADLQNIFDLSLVAALLQHERLADRAAWDYGTFATDGLYRPASYEPARVVDSVVNHRVYKGKDVVVQVAGGVRADLVGLLKGGDLVREQPRLGHLATQAKAPVLPEGRWWWDAAEVAPGR